MKPLLAATIIPPALSSPNVILRYCSNPCLICSDDSSSLSRREFSKQAIQRIEIC